MTRDEVLEVFQKRKDAYLSEIHPTEKPTAFLLGGQGAVGKGTLMNKVKQNNPNITSILSVNGDLYRTEHPDADSLLKDPESFSEKTQTFSIVFTEGLINEAISGQYNVVVEGTMRNPATPMKTAGMFKENHFRVEAYAIAAPSEFSSLNIYTRYANEVAVFGKGRLADRQSHDNAVKGLLISLDTLYQEKAVDAIHIFNCFARNEVATYHLENGRWDNAMLPSLAVSQTREEQKTDIETICDLIERSRQIDRIKLSEAIMEEVKKVRKDLLSLLAKDQKPSKVFELKDRTLAVRLPDSETSKRLNSQEITLYNMFKGKEEESLLLSALTRIHQISDLNRQVSIQQSFKR